MEIAYLSPVSVRIKGKQIALITNPESKKQTADATLLLGTRSSSTFFTEDQGVVLQAPGEYEVKGTKITGFRIGEQVVYTVRIEGLSILVGNVSGVLGGKDTLHEHDIAVLIADDVLSQGIAGVINASVVIMSGEKAEENMKAFGKENGKMSKYAITRDKLPAEAEFILLG